MWVQLVTLLLLLYTPERAELAEAGDVPKIPSACQAAEDEGDYDKALLCIEQAARRQRLTGASRNLLDLERIRLWRVGGLLRGATNASREFVDRVVERGDGSLWEVAGRVELALALHALDEQIEAIQQARRALSLARSLDREAAGRILLSAKLCAGLVLLAEDPEQALVLSQSAFASVDSQSQLQRAMALHQIGLAHAALGDAVQGEARMSEALVLLEAVLDAEHPMVAEVLLSISELVLSRGETGRSRLLATRALKVVDARLSDEHPLRAHLHSQLLRIYRDMRRLDDAITSGEIARELGAKIWGERSRFNLWVETNLSLILVRQGRQAEAKARLEAIHDQIDERYPALESEVVNLLGLLRMWDGDFEASERAFRRALEIRGRDLTLIDNIFNALWSQGRYAEAFPLLREVIGGHEKTLEMMWFPGRNDRKHQTVGKFAWPVFRAVSFHADRSTDAPMARESAEFAFLTIILRKGRILEDSVITTRARRETKEPRLRELHEQLIDVRAELAANAILGLQGDSEAKSRYLALADDTELIAAQLDDAVRSPGTHVGATSLSALQAALAEDAAHIEYFRYWNVDRMRQRPNERRYVAYVLRRDSFAWFDLGPAESIHKKIAALRKALSFRRADISTHAAAAYDLLLRPLEGALEGASALTIAPDYEIHQVPFASLYRRNAGYVVEHQSVHYLSTARDLMRPQRTKRHGADEVTVIANPAGARLPGAEDEARLVEGLFTNTQALRGLEASERAMRAVRRPAILHVATHGAFTTQWLQRDGATTRRRDMNDINEAAYQSMLRSTLVFSQSDVARGQGSGPVVDGFMTAYELEDLDLLGTELVVLSACESGLGRALDLEGQLGLRRALVTAGSQSQLVSLWRVSDAATPVLMENFYTRLADGLPRRDALAESQRELLRDPRTAHPYYWASFTLSGDWGPLPALTMREKAVKPVRGCSVEDPSEPSEGNLVIVILLASGGSRWRRGISRLWRRRVRAPITARKDASTDGSVEILRC